MREIKFRAWDKKNKKFIDSRFWVCFYDTPPSVIISNVPQNEQPDPKDIELIKYTGRKDINNKEIYKGDIIKGTYKEFDMHVDGFGRDLPRCPKCHPETPPKIVSDIYIVEFEGGSFYLQRHPVKGKFDFNYHDRIEVIGNIYENPELLKE
jgi:uncharacterized phage protein (TIGR01671 family)